MGDLYFRFETLNPKSFRGHGVEKSVEKAETLNPKP